MDAWEVVIALSGASGAAIAAVAAFQSRFSARDANKAASEANRAATALAEIERERRHAELTPLLYVKCEQITKANPDVMLSVSLVGPIGLTHVSSLKATIRDYDLRRAEQEQLYQSYVARDGGAAPTTEQVRKVIWGAYQFGPRGGPYSVPPDWTRRTAAYDRLLPVGETLTYLLEETSPPPWSTAGTSIETWRAFVGTTLRLSFTLTHEQYGTWTIPCELPTDVLDETATGTYAPKRPPP